MEHERVSGHPEPGEWYNRAQAVQFQSNKSDTTHLLKAACVMKGIKQKICGANFYFRCFTSFYFYHFHWKIRDVMWCDHLDQKGFKSFSVWCFLLKLSWELLLRKISAKRAILVVAHRVKAKNITFQPLTDRPVVRKQTFCIWIGMCA